MRLLSFIRHSNHPPKVPAAIPQSVTEKSFQHACSKFLRANGWDVNSEDIPDQPVASRNGLRLRLLFAPPTRRITREVQSDWIEARTYSPFPVVIVAHGEAEVALVNFSEESHILLCRYSELGALEEVGARHANSLRITKLSRHPVFSGIVDGFDPPSTLRGWVTLLGPDGLIDGFQIQVAMNRKIIATTKPAFPRPDVSGSDSYPAGFRVDCSGQLTSIDILERRVTVTATDPSGGVHPLTIWDRIIADIRLRELGDKDKSFLATDIGKLVLKHR